MDTSQLFSNVTLKPFQGPPVKTKPHFHVVWGCLLKFIHVMPPFTVLSRGLGKKRRETSEPWGSGHAQDVQGLLLNKQAPRNILGFRV